MPLMKLRPAQVIINKEVTDYTGQGKWTDGDISAFFSRICTKK